MTKTNAIVGGLALGLFGLAYIAPAQDSDPPAAGPTVVLGTFDSRAIGLAYYRSDEYREYIGDLHAQLAAAQAAGDEARVRELNELGPALQAKAHRQTFGSAPVLDLLEKIEDRLAGIAQQAGVDVMVSRWDLAYRRPEVATVDVTERLFLAFDPDEETRRGLPELLRHDPVPRSELENLDH